MAFALLRFSFLFFFVCLAISRPNTQVSKYAPASVSAFETALTIECQGVHPVATSTDAPEHAFCVAADRCPNDAEFAEVVPVKRLPAAPSKEC